MLFGFLNRFAICWIPLCSRTGVINLMVNILFILKALPGMSMRLGAA